MCFYAAWNTIIQNIFVGWLHSVKMNMNECPCNNRVNVSLIKHHWGGRGGAGGGAGGQRVFVVVWTKRHSVRLPAGLHQTRTRTDLVVQGGHGAPWVPPPALWASSPGWVDLLLSYGYISIEIYSSSSKSIHHAE